MLYLRSRIVRLPSALLRNYNVETPPATILPLVQPPGPGAQGRSYLVAPVSPWP
jgi:hypothetical protein